MMKRIVAVVMTLCFVFVLSGCGSADSGDLFAKFSSDTTRKDIKKMYNVSETVNGDGVENFDFIKGISGKLDFSYNSFSDDGHLVSVQWSYFPNENESVALNELYDKVYKIYSKSRDYESITYSTDSNKVKNTAVFEGKNGKKVYITEFEDFLTVSCHY